MLKNFWYAVAFAGELEKKPKRIRVLGQDLVLYRDSRGVAHCLNDLCAHRGGALSDGWVEGDCIVCPYHGWNYEAGGACIRIPANAKDTPIPRRARIDAYPTEERQGWIWVFLGDLPEAQRPPLPHLEHLASDSFKVITGEFLWKANYARVMENAVDIAHAPFVHGGAFGDPKRPEVPRFDTQVGDWCGETTVGVNASPSKGIWRHLYKGKKKNPVIETSNGFFMANITWLHVRLPLGNMILYDANIPVDEGTTLTKWMQLRDFMRGRWADGDSRRRVQKVFEQDQKIVEAVRPELMPWNLDAELHIRSDNNQVAYRKMRLDALKRGWGIDAHRIESDAAGRPTVVIPSPARREHPEFAKAWEAWRRPAEGA